MRRGGSITETTQAGAFLTANDGSLLRRLSVLAPPTNGVLYHQTSMI